MPTMVAMIDTSNDALFPMFFISTSNKADEPNAAAIPNITPADKSVIIVAAIKAI